MKKDIEKIDKTTGSPKDTDRDSTKRNGDMGKQTNHKDGKNTQPGALVTWPGERRGNWATTTERKRLASGD